MEKYLKYSVEELALEESFINWVKDANSADSIFWNDWLKANPAEESKISKAKLLVESIQFKETPQSKSKENDLWDKINKETTQKASPSIPIQTAKRRNILPWIGIAAGLLALVFFPIGGNQQTKIKKSFAQIEKIDLPDGSIVDLNAGSTLKFDEKNFKDHRILQLDGEAFFNVQKGSSFKVQTPNGEVEVLGTSFNVYSRDVILNVNCQSGKVAVRSGQEKTILIANEKVNVFANKVHLKSKVNAVSRSDWKKGIYHYQGADLKSIVDDIKRQWDVNVAIQKGLEELKFTGSFKTDHIENAIAEVCWPLGVKYELKDKNIRIFKD